MTPGKIKKLQRKENKKGLKAYYIKIQNTRTGYTKLVTIDKANEMINGRIVDYNNDGPIRKLFLKDAYVEVQ